MAKWCDAESGVLRRDFQSPHRGLAIYRGEMIQIAILDDYQNVALSMADSSVLDERPIMRTTDNP